VLISNIRIHLVPTPNIFIFSSNALRLGQHFHSTHPLANTLQVHSTSTDVDADECAPRLTQWRVESAIKKDMKTSPGLGSSVLEGRQKWRSQVWGLGADSILNEMKTRCFHFGPQPNVSLG